ncbi:acyltransferase [Kovacikia minuta CCNUW1]|uniref:acyltransferase n=1 Tax=Kovacikia minuta TaxID=2931930 RepID=UPI001CCE4176|nr:acyltransferase [Kovacikia minuta]UBF27341.1 acyltransferase [Kovacikia minuta CCNUW1]
MQMVAIYNKSVLGIILNRLKPLQNLWRIIVFRSIGIEIASSCSIGTGVKGSPGFLKGNRGKIQIGEKTELSQGAILECWGGSILIEDNVFIGPYTVIYGQGGVRIGKDSLIAMHCRILSSTHAIPERNAPIRHQPNILQPTTIGEDVWLGGSVTVLGGVTIGNGCVVGAGAVVTKDLPPYSIAVGVPAKVVRTRL